MLLLTGRAAELVPQAFRVGVSVRPLPSPCGPDDFLHLAPGRHAVPRPEAFSEAVIALSFGYMWHTFR